MTRTGHTASHNIVARPIVLTYATSTTASISTVMLKGSDAIPTAQRACRPRSPKTSTNRSEQTVDDLWVVGKLRHGVYHAEHSAEAYHLIEATRGFPIIIGSQRVAAIRASTKITFARSAYCPDGTR